MYNDLHRLGVIDFPNPIGRIRKVKTLDRKLTFLSHEQTGALLEALSNIRDAHLVLDHLAEARTLNPLTSGGHLPE